MRTLTEIVAQQVTVLANGRSPTLPPAEISAVVPPAAPSETSAPSEEPEVIRVPRRRRADPATD